MNGHNALAEWLIEQCENQNLSWAEASRRAGLSENSISQAVNGVSVGPKRLTALAEFFGTPPEYLFRMAGLLPSRSDAPPEDDFDEETRAIIDLTFELIQFIRKHAGPDAVRRLVNLYYTQAQLQRALIEDTLQPNEEKSNPP